MESKELLIQKIKLEAETYNFKTKGRVRFHEVDSYKVVHNLQYFYWLEWSRLEYLRALGIKIKQDTLINEYLFMSVHSEIDYFNAAKFDDEYEVLSKISYVKNSSVTFRNIIRLLDGTILAVASAVLVHLDAKEQQPKRIDDDLRNKIMKFEKNNVVIPV